MQPVHCRWKHRSTHSDFSFQVFVLAVPRIIKTFYIDRQYLYTEVSPVNGEIMTLCPIAIAAGCKKCPAFSFCPAKSILGDQPKKGDSAANPSDKNK